jgi:hypothetical protein
MAQFWPRFNRGLKRVAEISAAGRTGRPRFDSDRAFAYRGASAHGGFSPINRIESGDSGLPEKPAQLKRILRGLNYGGKRNEVTRILSPTCRFPY